MVSVCRLRIRGQDVGALSQAAPERNVLTRGFVERDQEIVWRDSRSRDHAVVQRLQQAQSHLLGTAGDKRDLQQNQVIRIAEPQERPRMKELAPRQNVNNLKEVFRRNAQGADETMVNRAGNFAETSVVILSFEDVDFGDRHWESPLTVVTCAALTTTHPKVSTRQRRSPHDGGTRCS